MKYLCNNWKECKSLICGHKKPHEHNRHNCDAECPKVLGAQCIPLKTKEELDERK